MKTIKTVFFVWAIITTVTLSVILRMRTQQPTQAKTFCAYGRIFVEFDEEGKRWGTMMLDWNGKPIPCKEDSEPDISNTI